MSSKVVQASGLHAAQDRFEGWWSKRGEWVEPPNQRRGGESGVQRLHLRGSERLLYLKRQQGHVYRSWLHPFGRPTALRERDALLAFERLGVGVPRLRYCDARKDGNGWRALLVSEALEGYVSLDQWYADDARARWGEDVHRSMLRQLGATLARLHRARWQHGCCYAKHLFVKVCSGAPGTPVAVALLDLEKSRRRWRPTSASRHDMAQLQRHLGGMPEADWQYLAAHYRQCFECTEESRNDR